MTEFPKQETGGKADRYRETERDRLSKVAEFPTLQREKDFQMRKRENFLSQRERIFKATERERKRARFPHLRMGGGEGGRKQRRVWVFLDAREGVGMKIFSETRERETETERQRERDRERDRERFSLPVPLTGYQ